MSDSDPTNPDNVFDDIEEQYEDDVSEAEDRPVNVGAINKDTVIAALEVEVSEMKDRVLRSVAEMENLRKRTQREVSEARTYAIADFARDMLSATDNLERALAAVPQESRDAADAEVKALIEGIEMTDREMQRLMQKNGVKPIIAEGERFDPHKHQAMFEVPNTEVPSGTVVQVLQNGFEIGDRVLRPALVGVAKGGAKPQVVPHPAASDSMQSGEPIPPEGEHIDKEV